VAAVEQEGDGVDAALVAGAGIQVKQPSVFRIDNQSALTVAKNPEHHGA